MKPIAAILAAFALTGCGVGSDPLPEVRRVALSATTVLPSPFVLGPSGEPATPSTPVVTFVSGPVAGAPAIVNPPIFVQPTISVRSPINWCTDGFVVGPCTPLPSTCQPNAAGFVTGPC